MKLPPANMQLRRAQLVLMLATLFPTILLTVVGIVLIAHGGTATTAVLGVMVLTLCTSGITGYILSSVFVGKGASLARMQNDFVSSVSHELRTPLTSIQLFIESLRSDQLEAADREQVLTLLGQEAKRLEGLVDRVLELSRLESGSRVWPRAPVHVLDLVVEALGAFDAGTLANPTAVDVDIESGLIVIGDRPTLVRAIANLLGNAWKYSGQDKRIAIVARTASRRWVEVTVRDNGIGIDVSERAVMLEQFTRGRAAAETGAPGFGLGLAFVLAIVRGHRGKLRIQSRPGCTEITLRLRRGYESIGQISADASARAANASSATGATA